MKTFKLRKQILAGFAALMLIPVSSIGEMAGKTRTNQFWWPDQLDLTTLRDHDARSNPLGGEFNYAEAFGALDLDALKADVFVLAAVALPILRWTKDRLAKEAILFRPQTTVIDRLRLENLSI